MMQTDFSVEQTSFVIFDREINDWGQSDPPLLMDPINAKGQLIQGMGGGSVAFNNHQRWRVTFNLLPGSPASKFIANKVKSGAIGVEASYANLASDESAVFSEGIFVNYGSKGRGGPAMSDDQYIFEFNNGTMGAG